MALIREFRSACESVSQRRLWRIVRWSTLKDQRYRATPCPASSSVREWQSEAAQRKCPILEDLPVMSTCESQNNTHRKIWENNFYKSKQTQVYDKIKWPRTVSELDRVSDGANEGLHHRQRIQRAFSAWQMSDKSQQHTQRAIQVPSSIEHHWMHTGLVSMPHVRDGSVRGFEF